MITKKYDNLEKITRNHGKLFYPNEQKYLVFINIFDKLLNFKSNVDWGHKRYNVIIKLNFS